ncbi:hypothetical protein CR513_09733, partial [Mucuna pruriens]
MALKTHRSTYKHSKHKHISVVETTLLVVSIYPRHATWSRDEMAKWLEVANLFDIKQTKSEILK